jgi:hypothetical protein
MYRLKKRHIPARTSRLLLPFRYAATVLYNSNNRMQRGGEFNSPSSSSFGKARGDEEAASDTQSPSLVSFAPSLTIVLVS